MGLKQALERQSDFTVLWELPSANNLDSQLKRTPVDVVLMDLFMGRGKDGIAATRELTERWPRIKVVVISASVDDAGVVASARAGADGFLTKDLPVAEMVSSIRQLAGKEESSKRVTGDRLDAMSRNARPKSSSKARRLAAGFERLSPRQRQVLDELRLGRTNREIAERLGISIATVNKHVHEVLSALNVRNRTQAAAAANTA
jgi:DNA-binding NarL/FixJ family response regulator